MTANINLFCQTDFVIPDAPAFAVIQKEPTAILRASDSKELMLNVGSSLISESLNQNPWGLEYSLDKKYHFPIAFSFATNLSPIRSIALGIRYNLINEVEAQKDTTFNKAIHELSKLSGDFGRLATIQVAENHKITLEEASIQYTDEIATVANIMLIQSKEFNLYKDSAKIYAENLLWNEKIFSLAIASRFSSSDDSYGMLNINDRKIQFWGIYTFKIGSTIQLNANFTALNEKNYSIDTSSAGIVVRGLYGSNSLKGFLDASTIFANGSKPKIEFSLGTEFRLIDNFWLVGRLVYNAISEKVVPTFDLKVGI